MIPVGRPEVQMLRGVAHNRRIAIFFSLMAYTDAAKSFAEESGVALFRFNGYNGSVEPVGRLAEQLVERGSDTGARTILSKMASGEIELKELLALARTSNRSLRSLPVSVVLESVPGL